MRFSLRTLFMVLTLVICVGSYLRWYAMSMEDLMDSALRRTLLSAVSDRGGHYHSYKGLSEEEAEAHIDLIRVPVAMSHEFELLRRLCPNAEVILEQTLPDRP